MRKLITIGDLGTIITGKTPPTTNKNYYGDYAVFIKPTDISEQCKFTYETEEMYSKLAAEKYESSLIPKGAICVPCIGTIGTKMTMAPCDCYTNQSINSIVCNDRYDNEYVYYLIKNFLPGLKSYNLGTASGREYVSKSNFEKIELVAEQDKTIQKKIGEFLSRYDSLIENYQKQIKLLEEAEQRLYKEWFVDLHFPGHENTKIVDGLPEGWEKKKVKEVCDTTSGGTPSRSKTEFYTGDILWVKTKELNDDFIFDTEEKITKDAIRNSSAKMVPSGSILMAMYGATIGKLGIATKELSCNQACCVFLLPEDSTLRLYLYNWLLNSRTLLISMGKGAAQPNLSQDMIKNLEVVVPSSCLLAKFDSKVKPLYRIMSYHSSQIRLLTEARDRLLPKMMSGEIKIESLN